MTCSRYLKVCTDLPKYQLNTFGAIRYLPEDFWAKKIHKDRVKPRTDPCFKEIIFSEFDLKFYWTKVAFPCSRKFRKDLWLFQKYFQLYLGRSRNTFRYLEHVTQMSRGFKKNWKRNISILSSREPIFEKYELKFWLDILYSQK